MLSMPSGRIAFVVNTCRCNVPNYVDIKDFELGTAPLPKGTAGRITRDGPNAIGIVKSSKNLDTAWDFTKWFVSQEGQESFLMTRRSVPTRKSIAESPVWRKALLPWERMEHYTEAMRLVRPMRYPVEWEEISKVWNTEAGAVLRGEKSAREAADTVKPVIDSLLAAK